ncbi:MAG: hypothetical protein QF393_20105 [Rhodospirillales bacterium]|jgi:hypothetical protein|nr:hypothetical protein [Rhodospirillales bacterium]|tara:strand:+ start:415 stop:609 length:195 start_codon:yes stop_codon:yes gene_type:complete
MIVTTLSPKLEFSEQSDWREFVWLALEGQPPIRQLKLILEARECGILDDGDTETFISAAGLEGA